MSKYEGLSQFLQSRQTGACRLSFDQVEQVLGFELPKSAYAYEAWWSNNETGHSHARAWRSVGWKTAEIDLARRHVTFKRGEQQTAATPRTRKADPWGCMAGTLTIMPGTDLTAPSGEEWNAEKGILGE